MMCPKLKFCGVGTLQMALSSQSDKLLPNWTDPKTSTNTYKQLQTHFINFHRCQKRLLLCFTLQTTIFPLRKTTQLQLRCQDHPRSVFRAVPVPAVPGPPFSGRIKNISRGQGRVREGLSIFVVFWVWWFRMILYRSKLFHVIPNFIVFCNHFEHFGTLAVIVNHRCRSDRADICMFSNRQAIVTG